MARYFIELSYKGTSFNGWQIQPNGASIQGEIERVLSLLVGEKIAITGAGRTDAGVHASYYVAHFDVGKLPFDNELFLRKLNGVLHKNIAIYSVQEVAENAHARFDAISRTYFYRISPTKNPFSEGLSFHFYRNLDIEKMNEAAKIILENEDFTSFAKLHSDVKNNLCKVYEAFWFREENEIVFKIRANRFLRNMVRAVVGTLIEVGLGKIQAEDLHAIFAKKNRCAAGMSVPAQGLYLADIEYPKEIFTPISRSDYK